VKELKTVRMINGVGRLVPVARKDTQESEICLIDYAHCPQHDLCWIADFGSGCDSKDNCFVDTN